MRTASIVAAGLLTSCGMPSDSLLIADLVIECPSLQTDDLRDILISFAERNGQKADVQEISQSYLRMHMDGTGFGHGIFIERGSPDILRVEGRCGSQSSSCVRAMVFAGGSTPEDELTKNTAHQREVAHLLEETVASACES